MAENEAMHERYGKHVVITRTDVEHDVPEFHTPDAVQTGGHLIADDAPLTDGFMTMPVKHVVCFAVPCVVCFPLEAM